MKYQKRITTLLAFVLISNISVAQYRENSNLATGDVYKIGIPQDGIYKIDKNYLEATLNIDVSNIDPRNISIYGNGGGIIPEAIAEFRFDDVEENAIYVKGESDGKFDDSDYILFYAEGSDKWDYDLSSDSYSYEKNIYDIKNYYFLKINDQSGKRIQNIDNSNLNIDQSFDVTETRLHYENDLINLLGSFSSTEGTGQTWYGEVFSTNVQQSFGQFFTLQNPVIGELAHLELGMAARSSSTSQAIINIDGMESFISFPSTSVGNVEANYAQRRIRKINFGVQNNNPQISLQYIGNSNSNAWLDYINLIVQEQIVYQGNPLYISNSASLAFNNVEFELTGNTQNTIAWDLNNPTEILSYPVNNLGANSSIKYEVQEDLTQLVIFNTDDNFSNPEFIEKIENQNLHSIDNIEYAIVYASQFKEAAFNLANHRAAHDGISVEPILVDHIYNEFASGKKDPTAIRDFVRMLKERNPLFNFLLLFGDASYDYRGIVEGIEYQNFVPTYETKESMSPIYGFPSDDYYALISDNEGGDNLKGALDISVGRLPARDSIDAIEMVNKIIHYDTDSGTLGEWKLNVCFVADDEDTNTHLKDSEEIANTNETNYPFLNQQKVYFDAYEQVSTPGGERYPEANQAINKSVDQGVLVMNYLGHGGPKGWAQERVLQVNDVNSWSDRNKMPIIVTATCSFTGFDDPALITAGEHAISNAMGGSVALFTTVRAVFASENKRLAASVFDQMFVLEDGTPRRLGDILRTAKNANSEDTLRTNARKFALIGDPSMQIGLPKNKIVLERINNTDISVFEDTIKALSSVQLEGSVKDKDDDFLDNFNGIIYLTVFDKHSKITTLVNDSDSRLTDFFVRKNVLFKGSASVVNGKFSIDFILPKDINFETGFGKFSFYAHDMESKDAAGYYDQIVIGDSSGELADDAAPVIELFMNDESFRNGGITDENPVLLVKLKDDFGINVSGTSIGHDLSLVLDDQNDQTTILNDFYEANINDFRGGTVRYPLKDLSVGLHSVRVKAWDISNNSSEATLEFNVIEAGNQNLFDVINYPNPFDHVTNFAFEHDLGGENINIAIDIYTITGKYVTTINNSRVGSGYRVSDVFWDGTDNSGNKLSKGIYIYKIGINSSSTGEIRNSEFRKLIIL